MIGIWFVRQDIRWSPHEVSTSGPTLFFRVLVMVTGAADFDTVRMSICIYDCLFCGSKPLIDTE